MTRHVWLAAVLLIVFSIVSPAGQVDAQDSTLVHVVQPGESLLDLALFYNVPLYDLARMNQLESSRRVRAGQEIRIPVSFDNRSAPDNAADAPANTSQPATYTVQRGDTLFQIATAYNIPMNVLAAANQLASYDTIYVGQQLTIPTDIEGVILIPEPESEPEPEPLPTPDADGKQILVVLSEQKVYAYENGVLLREFVVSTGLPATPTVRGDFHIYIKYEAQRMSGPGYDLPNVPWVMYFYRGYGLHGTYWHENFGNPMSHGCVNMRTPEAEWLYNWAPVGTPVKVID